MANPARINVGDIVCDCNFRHMKVVAVSQEGFDAELTLEDGTRCSALRCCHTVPHDWSHPAEPGKTTLS